MLLLKFPALIFQAFKPSLIKILIYYVFDALPWKLKRELGLFWHCAIAVAAIFVSHLEDKLTVLALRVHIIVVTYLLLHSMNAPFLKFMKNSITCSLKIAATNMSIYLKFHNYGKVKHITIFTCLRKNEKEKKSSSMFPFILNFPSWFCFVPPTVLINEKIVMY